MAQYIEAPSLELFEHERRLFLAGGITDCPNWQSVMAEKLSDLDITIYNPRRANFPIHDPNAAREQITWEFHRLNDATDISFWFCKETICPIVLYELGRHLARSKAEIFIGMDPEYKRRQDVEIQSELACDGMPLFGKDPGIKIHFSLDDLCDAIGESIG